MNSLALNCCFRLKEFSLSLKRCTCPCTMLNKASWISFFVPNLRGGGQVLIHFTGFALMIAHKLLKATWSSITFISRTGATT